MLASDGGALTVIEMWSFQWSHKSRSRFLLNAQKKPGMTEADSSARVLSELLASCRDQKIVPEFTHHSAGSHDPDRPQKKRKKKKKKPAEGSILSPSMKDG